MWLQGPGKIAPWSGQQYAHAPLALGRVESGCSSPYGSLPILPGNRHIGQFCLPLLLEDAVMSGREGLEHELAVRPSCFRLTRVL